MAFCSSAQCEILAETRLNVVILTPLKAKLFSLPVQGYCGGSWTEGWISAIAITPWFNLVESSYLGDIPIWATAVSCLVVLLATSFSIFYCWQTPRLLQVRWAILTAIFASFGTCFCLTMSAGFWAKVTTGHRVANSKRGLMTLGATS